mgnify:CR=1 FL=1
MPDWLHVLYDAGMSDVDITSMVSIGVAQSMQFALKDHDVYMMTKLLEWSKVVDKCMYTCIDEAVTKK